MMISLPNPINKMKNTAELEEILYDKCREDSDLLATVISEYVMTLSDSKLDELKDLIVNNFGDD